MEDIYEIRKGVPVPPSVKYKTGMTDTLRKMEHQDSIVVPNSKRGSVYACAAQAGIKVVTQSNPDGLNVTVWRVDEPSGAGKSVADRPGSKSVESSIYTPDGGLPTGHYAQETPYGPNIFYPDLDGQGRPVNLSKKKASSPSPSSSSSSQPRRATRETIFD